MHKSPANPIKAVLAVLAAGAALMLGRPASAEVLRYDPGDTVYFTYCYAHPVAMRIKPGDSVVTHTRDASNDVFTPTDTTFSNKVNLAKVNPQTGPFYIEGAEPGDTLVVHLDSIETARDWGWGASIPYFGVLAPEFKTMMVTPPAPDHLFIWHFDRGRNVAVLEMPNSKIGRVEVPLRPFLGTIGTAPGGKECISSLYPGPYGANMDFREVVAGVTLYFPVNEPGALFFLGDGHAAQGDGEIDGAAIETAMNVRFTVDLLKGKRTAWPHLVNDTEFMSIGSTRPLVDALRLGCSDLVNVLTSDFGYDRYEAVELLGEAGHLRIANVVDPQYSVACSIDKRYLPR
jgi:amidase